MSSQLANIHDAFFKQVLGDPELAGTFLREHLPSEVADLLGPELPEQVPGSFVDEELRQHHSDLVFRVHLKAGRDAFAYVLMEHKSSPDPGARLQLLRYVVRLLTRWYDQNKPQLPLPPVLPLLAHQGLEGWKLSCDFADLFSTVPEPLRPYLPSFRHALVDLALTDDQALSAKTRLRAFLKALKYSRRPDLPACIDIVFAEADTLGEDDLFVILEYFDKGPVAISKCMIADALRRLVPDKKEKLMGWLTQPYYDQGKAEGRAEGRAEMLARVLENRFGAIPMSLRQRIFAADTESIEAWVDRALKVSDVNLVFDSN
jgi:hypothetical protein